MFTMTIRAGKAASICALVLALVSPASVSARELLICNYIGSPAAQTKLYELTPATILRCKDKELGVITNSLAGLYAIGFHLISVVPYETEYEGKTVTVLQYYLDK
jgi:hypothetical protein